MLEYANLTELWYYVLHPEESIKFDVSFLIDQALDNKDQEMFEWIVNCL